MIANKIQEATIVDDTRRYLPRTCVALGNKKAKNQSHIIEVEGMINKHPLENFN